MTREILLRLLSFYLDCVESEDRRSLTKQLASLHQSLVSPWDKEEPFFHPRATEVVFEVESASDRRLLAGASAILGGPEGFFYGYPLFLDGEGLLMPLFFTEVEVEHRGEGRFAFRPVEVGEIHLNHHMLNRLHAHVEEIRDLQEELEGEFGSFADRLRAALDALGISAQPCPRTPLDGYPKDDSPRGRWVNRPILFKSERSLYTHHLRQELGVLAGYDRLSAEIGNTSLGLMAQVVRPPLGGGPARGPDVPLLQVLPLNARQERAALLALNQPLSVVTGPPGTGKSQVVVDLLASCALAGRPVLFASKNNKAVNVVRERLREIMGEEYDWTLRLGNRTMMEESRQEMSERIGRLGLGTLPASPSAQALLMVEAEIDSVQWAIAGLEEAHVRYISREKDRRAAEDLIPPAWVEEWPDADVVPLPSRGRVERLATRTATLAGLRPAGLWLRLARAIVPWLLLRRARAELALLCESMPPFIQTDLRAIAERQGGSPYASLAEASRELVKIMAWRVAEESCSKALGELRKRDPADVLSARLEKLRASQSGLAADRLRSAWTARIAGRRGAIKHALDTYHETGARLRQTRGREFFPVLDHYKRAIQSVGRDLPVWIVTNLSVHNALPLEPDLFDLVIIDEASQCDVPSAIPLLFRARRAMIIGDPRQLRHISTLPPKEEELLALKHHVEELVPEWSYNQCSLYALAEGVVTGSGQEPSFLAEHYRSHPDIIAFSNREFYGGLLVPRTKIDLLQGRMKDEPLGLFWHDVRGSVPLVLHSSTNEVEVRAVVDLLDAWARSGFLLRENVGFGVVTPFRLQMERIEQALQACPWWELAKDRIAIGTAHRFQGDERDVVIFSPVVAEGMLERRIRWVADTDNLLNVALTRARCALHVVGDRKACIAAGGFLGEFAAAVQDDTTLRDPARLCESAAEVRVAELLDEIKLWYAPQHEVGRHRLDFLVVTPFGRRWDIEVDGRGHRTDSAIMEDEARDAAIAKADFRILRIDARRLFRDEGSVRDALRRLA